MGLGVQLAATNTNFNQGSNQTTGRATDLMIQGDGMFVVQKGNDQLYTRAGAFSFDQSGNLVAPGGGLVQGYRPSTPPATTPADRHDHAADRRRRHADAARAEVLRHRRRRQDHAPPSTTTAARSSPRSRSPTSTTRWVSRRSAAPASARPPTRAPPQLGVAGEGSRGELVAGSLEMSNVDLAAEFTNLILAQRGFQASSRVITTSDQVLEELVNIKR